MGFSIAWVPDEPILLVTASGMISANDFTTMYAEVAAMIDGVQHKIYRIADYTAADSSFLDIMKAVKSASANTPGSSSDTRLQTIYVGTSHWINLARTALQQPQFGGIMIPTFHDLDDALTYTRREIAKAHTTTAV